MRRTESDWEEEEVTVASLCGETSGVAAAAAAGSAMRRLSSALSGPKRPGCAASSFSSSPRHLRHPPPLSLPLRRRRHRHRPPRLAWLCRLQRWAGLGWEAGKRAGSCVGRGAAQRGAGEERERPEPRRAHCALAVAASIPAAFGLCRVASFVAWQWHLHGCRARRGLHCSQVSFTAGVR